MFERRNWHVCYLHIFARIVIATCVCAFVLGKCLCYVWNLKRLLSSRQSMFGVGFMFESLLAIERDSIFEWFERKVFVFTISRLLFARDWFVSRVLFRTLVNEISSDNVFVLGVLFRTLVKEISGDSVFVWGVHFEANSLFTEYNSCVKVFKRTFVGKCSCYGAFSWRDWDPHRGEDP